jgi:predicted acylesterase/phospholipase RssA
VSAPNVPEEEVRVAMALNGGVSLAVWMGGGAVELDCARRAHGGPEPIVGFPTRTIYHAVCSAFARRLVVDVMSGSSAGGINGALLAAASVHRRRLHPDYLRERWIALGDAGALLRKLSDADPHSLMDGGYFYDKLRDTFREVIADDDRNIAPIEPAAPDPPPGLDVTTTNVYGEDRRYKDSWGGEITALEYRARYRFREETDFTVDNLAVAARSSASFPLAFEPFVVDQDDAKRLAAFPDNRAVIDGGLLDNAPIAAAIELVKARPARGYVKRYLCYVNGAPKDVTARKQDTPDDFEPRLAKVLANVLGLPRSAPFADQLIALEEATWRGGPTHSAELALLGLDLPALTENAGALLGIYRDRRTEVSLRELPPPPEDGAPPPPAELPWIPESLDPPAPGSWGWGVQAARRVHHLVADLIREAIRTGDPAGHPELMAARAAIDEQIALAEARRRDPDRHASVQAARTAVASDDASLREEVLATAAAAFGVRRLLGVQEGVAVAPALFGPGWEGAALTAAEEQAFLRRVLAVEVVRRAFAMERDIDDSQRFAFAQLTPAAPTPLLDAKPMTEPSELRSPETKLTGIRLAHFSAFHRRSWRANDFLWGRLDGAARVIDMLVDASRAIDVQSTRPWEPLAVALTPTADDTFAAAQRELVAEALDDAGAAAGPDLRARLAAALEHDLAEQTLSERGTLTRVLCIRAAQLEVLAHELPTLVETAAEDSAEGASTAPLPLDPADLLGSVHALRALDLPGVLGRDAPAEAVSDMALRTISRGGLVTVALLRGSGIPLLPALQVLRAPLLAVSGMVVRARVLRLVVLLAYAAAALFLAVRAAAVTTASSDFEQASKDALILALVAALTVLGVLLVPLLRWWGRRSWDRWVHLGVAVVALAGVIASAVVPGMLGDRSWVDLVIAAGFDPPPAVFWLAFALVLCKAPFGLLRRYVEVPWRPVEGPLLAAAAALVVGGWSLYELFDGPALRWWALLGLAASVAAVALYLLAQARLMRALALRLTSAPADSG